MSGLNLGRILASTDSGIPLLPPAVIVSVARIAPHDQEFE
jgi:hypothetical protein